MQKLLEMKGISKRFGPTRALHKVDLTVRAGEVLALIGENGAGKSTLLKTLSGAHQADSGSMKIGILNYVPKGPSDARRAGVAMIYQELNLAPDLSVEDNIMLGASGTGFGVLFRHQQRPKIRTALQTVGLSELNPKAIVGEQSVATQQLIEIARALVLNAQIILFDEPTSSLPQKDVQTLFEIVRRLRNEGLGIVYISHFLEEVRTIADRYSVLRDGEHVGTGNIKDVTDAQIISLMVGRDINDLYPKVPHTPGETWVSIKNLTGAPYPKNVSIDLRKGEILGIAGLVGAGRTELLRSIFSIDPIESGSVRVAEVKTRNSIRAKMRAGFGMLSEDRKGEGLAQDLSIHENISLSSLGQYSNFGVLNLPRRNRAANELMKQVEVKAHSGKQAVSELSGGNQQKVAIARILHEKADILLMDEPTKGIDVGTKAEIYRMMGELAADGKSVVFVSSYLPELLAVCDRIAVMCRGEIREVRTAADWTEDDIMRTAVDLDDSDA